MNFIDQLFFLESILTSDPTTLTSLQTYANSLKHTHPEQAIQAKQAVATFIAQLPPIPEQEKKVKRLYFDGCFDLMHSGHFNALRQAKELCETLVVGVITSNAIAKAKGPPIMTDDERYALVKACKWADEVVMQDAYDPTIEILDQNNCSHVAHGDDLVQTSDGQDAYQPFKDAGRMKVFKRTEGISTTDIVGRMLLMTKEGMWEEKKVFKNVHQGLEASNINQLELDQVSIEATLNNKILNTTRRIMQFSNDRKPLSGHTIVYIDGSFDILHPGHVETLMKARAMGHFLYVGVYDNDTINRLKGKNYPILNLQERVLNLLALQFVDEVIIGVPYKVTEQLIKNFKIDVVAEGSSTYTLKSGDQYDIPKQMGIHRVIDSGFKVNADDLVERILQNRSRFLEKYNSKKKKEIIFYEGHDYKVTEI